MKGQSTGFAATLDSRKIVICLGLSNWKNAAAIKWVGAATGTIRWRGASLRDVLNFQCL